MSFFTKLKKEIGLEEEETSLERKPIKQKSSAKEKKEKRPKPKNLESAQTNKDSDNSDNTEKATRIKASANEQLADSEKTEEKTEKQRLWSEKTGELAIDLFQTADFLVVQSAIAGIKPENLEITLEEDMLIIKGERNKPLLEEQKPVKYLYQECYWGPFCRKIVLPEEVDLEKAEASMKQGILTIKLPRVEKQKIKRIVVREE